MISKVIAQISSLAILVVIIRGTLQFKDITEALSFYGVYHRDPINQLIHFIGVPAIIWSLFGFLTFMSIPHPFSFSISYLPFIPKHEANSATILLAIYTTFNIKIDPFAGTLYAPFVYAMYATTVRATLHDRENDIVGQSKKTESIQSKASSTTASSKTSLWGTKKVLKMYTLVHFFGWYVQIHPGHLIYEGAKPAIFDSLGGAFTSAPLFAFYEGLWFMGIKTELQDQTKLLVDEYTQVICEKNENAMRACADIA